MSAYAKQLPVGWKRARLEEACEVILGQSPPGDTYNGKGNGLPFFQGKTEFGDYYPTPVKWCSAPTKIAEPEDVLISVRAPVGPTNLCPSKACIGRGLAAIRPKQGMPSRYVLYALRATVETLIEKATGSTFEAVSGTVLRSHEILVAPLAEQRRIVAEIEKQFTRLEAGIAALKRVQANLKRYRASVLKVACEGKLVPTEAELAKKEKRKYETGDELLERILKERRKNWTGRGKYREPVSPDALNFSSLPEGYAWATFGQLCRVQGGFAFKSTDYVMEGVPLVRISNLVNGRVQVKEDTVFLPARFASENSDFLLRKGDALIAMSGATTGKMATLNEDIPALLNQRVGRFVLSSAELSNQKFISLLVMQISAKVLKDAYGAAQPNISPSEIEEMPVPLPPLVEQAWIVAEVERRLSVVEELEAVVKLNLDRATRLRQAILQRAFSGGLV